MSSLLKANVDSEPRARRDLRERGPLVSASTPAVVIEYVEYYNVEQVRNNILPTVLYYTLLCLAYSKGWCCILPYSAQADTTPPPPSMLRSPAVARLMRMVGSRSADMGGDFTAESPTYAGDDGPVP